MQKRRGITDTFQAELALQTARIIDPEATKFVSIL